MTWWSKWWGTSGLLWKTAHRSFKWGAAPSRQVLPGPAWLKLHEPFKFKKKFQRPCVKHSCCLVEIAQEYKNWSSPGCPRLKTGCCWLHYVWYSNGLSRSSWEPSWSQCQWGLEVGLQLFASYSSCCANNIQKCAYMHCRQCLQCQ
jgi:hypothetical protein